MKTIAVAESILAVLLSAGSALGSTRSLPEAMQEFSARYGHQAIVALDEEDRGVVFAGLFASDPMAGDPGLAALSFLEAWDGLWGFDPVEHLVTGEVKSISTLTFVRLDQVHAGIPVVGSGVKVTLDPLGRVRQVVSRFGWSQGFAGPVPALGLAEAMDVLSRKAPHLVPTGQSLLVYLPGGSGEAPLCWVLRTHSRSGPEAPAVYVDAHTGEIAWMEDTNVYADGNVYDPNPVADPTVYRRELPNLTSSTNLDGTYAQSYSCTATGGGYDLCPDRVRYAGPDVSGNYLFDPTEPSTTDPFSEVMGYYHMDKINTHMETAYGHAYSCDGNRWMAIQVNMDYGNAWYGDQDDDGCPDLTVGQDAYDYAYDSAIIYHEFGHGINHDYSEFRGRFDGQGPDPSPAGIDEAMSDYWAGSFIGRPVIGEYASLGTPGELGFRDLSEFASCPDGFFGESHYDSPMLSTCMWDIREAIGQDKADRLALAMLGSLSSRPTYDEAGRALQSQAAALVSTGVLTTTDAAAVDTAVAAHTLVGCPRIVTLEDGDRHTFIGTGLWGGVVWAAGVQFMLYSPPGATRVTAVLEDYGSGDYTMYVRKGMPVHMTRVGDWPPELVVDGYDYSFAGSPDRVTFTEWSDPIIEEDTEYYFAFTYPNDIMLLDVSAIIVWVTPAEEDEDASIDVVVDTVEDPSTDVPLDPDATTDAPTDVRPDGGTITEEKGCGCTLAR